MKKSLIVVVLLLTVVAMAQQDSAQTQAPGGQAQAQGGQAAAGPTIKDPAEYNAYVTALNQSDPNAKAQALETFLQQYPNSVVKVGALELLMATYQQLGNQQKVVDAANRLLQGDPGNLRALALLTYLARQQAEQGGPNAATALQQASQYAQKGLQALQSAAKPPELSAADWEKLKSQTSAIFAGAAGMAALQQKDYANASRYLTQAVQAQPTDLRNVYPLALAYLQQKPQDVRGLWYIARAANLASGTPAEAQIAAYGKRAYRVYHGGEDGWDQLLAQAKTTPDPPQGFAVQPAPTPAEQAAKLAASKPVAQMSFDEFQLILTSGNQQAADQVWNQIKGKPIAFVAKVIDAGKTRLMLAATADDIQQNKADVDLTMKAPIPATLMPKTGAQTQVEGVPDTYDASPFMIHMNEGTLVQTKSAKPAAKAPAHKAPARRKPPQ
ncbi:MAG: tetratricopeptide repeat protein [Terriglobales bacterium]